MVKHVDREWVESIIVLYKGNWKRERPGISDISSEEFKEWVHCWTV